MKIFAWFLFWSHFLIFLIWALGGLALSGLGKLVDWFELEVMGWNIALGADQMGNVFAAGFPDETISSRTGRAIRTGRPTRTARILKFVINSIFFWQDDHVDEAVEREKEFNSRFEIWPWSHWTKEELAEKRKKGR